jgi:REP element-mobilizing transposase RayT
MAARKTQLKGPEDLLSNGYFARTIGKNTKAAVERYLDKQSEHHGYDRRRLPPVFLEQYELNREDMVRLSAKHNVVIAQFHLVLSTNKRLGILGSQEGRKIADRWQGLQNQLRVALIKLSFVPDHVHIAVRAHPSVSPVTIVVALMNAAQEVVQKEMIHAGLDRLWQPGAYIGSYGDLANTQVRKYIENWKST